MASENVTVQGCRTNYRLGMLIAEARIARRRYCVLRRGGGVEQGAWHAHDLMRDQVA